MTKLVFSLFFICAVVKYITTYRQSVHLSICRPTVCLSICQSQYPSIHPAEGLGRAGPGLGSWPKEGSSCPWGEPLNIHLNCRCTLLKSKRLVQEDTMIRLASVILFLYSPSGLKVPQVNRILKQLILQDAW